MYVFNKTTVSEVWKSWKSAHLYYDRKKQPLNSAQERQEQNLSREELEPE